MAESDKQDRSDAQAGPETPAEDAPANAAERVIARFGGLRPMANKLGIAVSTVQGWKARGQIPHARHDDIKAAAATHNITLDEGELAAADSAESGEPKPAAPSDEAKATQAPESGAAAEPAPAKDEPAETEPTGVELVAPAATQRRNALLTGAAIAVVALAVGVGAAVGLRDHWLPLVGAPGGSELSELSQRVAALESRPAGAEGTLRGEIAALREAQQNLDRRLAEASSGDAGALTAKLDAVRGKLDAVAERTGAIERNLAARDDLADRLGQLEREAVRQDAFTALGRNQQSLDERVGNLGDRLAAVEPGLIAAQQRVDEALAAARQATGPAARNAALALAAGQLREALRFGTPFAAALAPVERLAREDAQLSAAITPLRAYADAGVAPLDALRARFGAVADAVVAAARGESAGGWQDDLLLRFSELVSVRPVGDVEGEGPAARVAHAELHLQQGNLKAAIAELEGLQGPAAEAAQPWLHDAKARLQVEAALTELSRQVVERLTATQGE